MIAVDPITPRSATPMLPVEERRPADARPNRPGEYTALVDPPMADQRVERRPRPGVSWAVLRRRNLHHDTGIGATVGLFGELDVPVAVGFDLVDPPYPGGEGVHRTLPLRAGSAGVPRPEVGRRPSGEDRRYRCRLRQGGGERGVRLLGPAVVRLPARLRSERRSDREAGEPQRDDRVRPWHRPARAGAPGSPVDRRPAPAYDADRCHRNRGPRRWGLPALF